MERDQAYIVEYPDEEEPAEDIHEERRKGVHLVTEEEQLQNIVREIKKKPRRVEIEKEKM